MTFGSKKVRGTFLTSYLVIRKRVTIMKALGTQAIETERLILRRFVETDAQAMFDNWASQSENLTYVTWDPHLNVEQTRNSIANWVVL